MKTAPNYTEMMAAFQSEWEGSKIDLMEIAHKMAAAKAVLSCCLKKEPTPDQVIQMTQVIALMKFVGPA